MNDKLTGAFWKKGPMTDAVKIILPVSVKMSAARFFYFSVSSNRKYRITSAAACQFLSGRDREREWNRVPTKFDGRSNRKSMGFSPQIGFKMQKDGESIGVQTTMDRLWVTT
jgi:hypothetical protein